MDVSHYFRQEDIPICKEPDKTHTKNLISFIFSSLPRSDSTWIPNIITEGDYLTSCSSKGLQVEKVRVQIRTLSTTTTTPAPMEGDKVRY